MENGCKWQRNGFDLLLTVDRNLEYQQSFAGLELAVVVIHAVAARSGARDQVLRKRTQRQKSRDFNRALAATMCTGCGRDHAADQPPRPVAQ
jgi:hypothetical protein